MADLAASRDVPSTAEVAAADGVSQLDAIGSPPAGPRKGPGNGPRNGKGNGPRNGKASDVSVLARRSMLTLVGGIASGLLGFAAVFVASHGLGVGNTGRFFEGVSLFSIASSVLLLGSDIALMRFVSADRAEHRGEVRTLLRIALVPAVAVSIVAAVVGFVLAPELARVLSHGEDVAGLDTYLRCLILALPVAVAYLALVSTTRAFATVKPFVFIDKLARPGAQVVLLGIVVLTGAGAIGLAVAWALPVVLGLVITWWWLAGRIRREPRPESEPDTRALAASFWRFSLPRGVAGIFQVLILWLDTLLIGVFRPSSEVAVYVASTRYVLLVLFVGTAVTQAVAPQFGDLLARGEVRRAEVVYRAATVWNILVTWPLLVVLIVFAPVVLSVFGHEFETGAAVTRVLAASMLIATAVGPVDWILLMAGKSSWNLLNTAAALAINVALNVAFIPRYGIIAAGFAWGASVIVNNIAPLVEVMAFIKMSPFDRAHRIVSIASILCFAVPGVIAVTVLGQTPTALLVSAGLGGVVYLALLSRFADDIKVREMLAGLAFRRGKHAAADA